MLNNDGMNNMLESEFHQSIQMVFQFNCVLFDKKAEHLQDSGLNKESLLFIFGG